MRVDWRHHLRVLSISIPISWAIIVCAWLAFSRAGTSDTVEPVPGPPFGAQATFLSDLQRFLRFEDGARHAEMLQGFVVKGCIGTVSPNLTHTPTGLAGKCVAYPGGLRIVEAGSVSYLDNSLCWTIVHRDTSGNVTGPDGFVYTRVPGTHYAVNCTAPSLPQTPPNSVLVMQVTTTTGAITAVSDLRQLSPIQLRAAGQIGSGLPPSNNCLPGNKVCAGVSDCLPNTTLCGCLGTSTLCDGAVTTPKIAINATQNTAGRDPQPPDETGWTHAAIAATETVLNSVPLTTRGGRILVFAVISARVGGSTPQMEFRVRVDGVAGTLVTKGNLSFTGSDFVVTTVTLAGFVGGVPAGAHTIDVTGRCPSGLSFQISGYTHVVELA